MRVVVQRVKNAEVEIKGKIIANIERGLLVFVGIEKGDKEKEILFMAEKILNLRIFPDKKNKINLSIKEINGEILSISQFTLASHIKKGRRPDFNNAEEPLEAENLYNRFNDILSNDIKVEKGIFGSMMNIHSINEGPVTFIIEKNFID